MPYSTKQDMIDRFDEAALVELTDQQETGDINDTVLDKARNDAAALIDSYVSQYYSVPLSPVPDIIKRHECSIAFYYLHRGRYTDEVRKEFEDSQTFLRNVSRGEVKLPAAGIQPQSAPAEALVEGPERIFNRESLKSY